MCRPLTGALRGTKLKEAAESLFRVKFSDAGQPVKESLTLTGRLRPLCPPGRRGMAADRPRTDRGLTARTWTAAVMAHAYEGAGRAPKTPPLQEIQQ